MKSGMQILGAFLALVLYFIATTGCDPDTLGPISQSPTTGDVVTQAPTSNAVIMGSFNIQVFGRAKIGKSDVTNILVDVARRFDILAIQELRSTDQSIIPRFVDMINSDGSKFAYVVGPRQGYTISTEQYVYIYDSEKIELLDEPFVAPAPPNRIHRSPLVARFRCRTPNPDQGFTFTLLNVHVDPDEVAMEADTLVSVLNEVRRIQPYEDDLILLGDINAPPRFFQSYPWFNNQYPVVADDWATMTGKDLNRDNIVFDAMNTSEYLRQSGVMNLMHEYQISVEDAQLVSDHMPVWAVFSATEYSTQMANEEDAVLR